MGQLRDQGRNQKIPWNKWKLVHINLKSMGHRESSRRQEFMDLKTKPPPNGPRAKSRLAQRNPDKPPKPRPTLRFMSWVDALWCLLQDMWLLFMQHYQALCLTISGGLLTWVVVKRSEITFLNNSSPITRYLSYWGKKRFCQRAKGHCKGRDSSLCFQRVPLTV